MFSNIFLSKENLLSNVNELKRRANKKLCVMVKANAYGHGAKEIASMLDGEVEYFGVANQTEAEELRDVTNSHIIVFGACEDYAKCIENDIDFILISLEQAKEMVKLSKKVGKNANMHLCINTGMNRYGVKEKSEVKKIINLLRKNNMSLSGIYTHFSSLSTDEEYSKKQMEKFEDICSLLPNNWDTIKHIGGGKTITNGLNADMYRVGIAVLGYGESYLTPVLSVKSKIVDIQMVKKGEHIGYLCGFTAQKDMKVAVIPLGYGDGFPRKLSNNFSVEIRGKNAKNVGNVCMDAFMVDISDINCKIGDDVIVLKDATIFAEKIESTEYEVLTNLTKLRGKRIIY